MKKILLVLLMLFPCIVSAKVFYNFDTTVTGTNKYIENIIDGRMYLEKKIVLPFEYKNGNVTINNKYKSGGLLNLEEFNISKDKNGLTYLFDGQDYWTMTENNDKAYKVDISPKVYNSLINKNKDAGLRPTTFIKSNIKVSGEGTYANPWKFSQPSYNVNIVVVNGTASSSELSILSGDTMEVSITPRDGFAFSNASCTNEQKYNYNDLIFKIDEITNDTVCTIRYADATKIYTAVSTDRYVVPYKGYYKIEAQGAQGNGNGGLGGYASGVIYLNTSEQLDIVVGGMNGYNGGGTGLYNGGGASTIKRSNVILVAGAGGGGGTSGGAGGNGSAAGGAGYSGGSGTNGGPGSAGVNSGGGGSGYNYSYQANCSSCYYGSNTCSGATVSYNCSSCYYGSNTCSYGCSSCYDSCRYGSNTCSGGYDQGSCASWNYTTVRTCKTCYYNTFLETNCSACGSTTSRVKSSCASYNQIYNSCKYGSNTCSGGYYDCGCSSCYYGSNTCSYGCDSYYDSCYSGSNTCSYGCDTLSKSYNPGVGGSNNINSILENKTQNYGIRSGNGLIKITYLGEIKK